MGFDLTCNIIMIMLTCGFGVGVTPMVWSLLGDALNRYVQALCMCEVFTEAQEHVHAAIRGTL